MNCALLTIGDELLIGQVLNSNNHWMSQKLTDLGVSVTHHLTVGDKTKSIHDALTYLFAATPKLDTIIIGGGLGPTHDDLTIEALSEYFSIPLVYDQEWMNKVEAFFKARNRVMSENNKKQGFALTGATRIDNDCGTAAGQHFTAQLPQAIEIFVVPGVPHEMKSMMERYILPALQLKTNKGSILKKTLLVTGIGESALAQKCEPFVKKIKTLQQEKQLNLSLAFLPGSTELRLRLQLETPAGGSPALEKMFDELVQELTQICGADYFGLEPQLLEEILVQTLTNQKKTVSFAESCTGGLIAHRLTQIPGASVVLKGSLVTYQEAVKTLELGISPEFIQTHGVVSERVAREMAQSIRKKWGTDFGVATTGYLGPTGGDEHSPLGTVWVAVATPTQTLVKDFTFVEKHRERNKERAAQAALDFLRRSIDR